MGVTIVTDGSNEPMFALPSKMWVNATKDEVVAEGSVEASFLLGLKDELIPLAQAERLGLVNSPKSRRPSADKQRRIEEDK